MLSGFTPHRNVENKIAEASSTSKVAQLAEMLDRLKEEEEAIVELFNRPKVKIDENEGRTTFPVKRQASSLFSPQESVGSEEIYQDDVDVEGTPTNLADNASYSKPIQDDSDFHYYIERINAWLEC